ncbi:MAG: hypothetical protein OXU62_07925 [Gammaproteobacteria bacterium]|nr:hypothetical protein [Gammaproteobacteria bacterium]MDD9884445.1 hypothetical protein [Gammaproteobacteria bacterium]
MTIDNANTNGAGRNRRGWLRRGPCETAAAVLIVAGIAMMMQPFSMLLYGYSFVTILTGTLGFVVVSHFPK